MGSGSLKVIAKERQRKKIWALVIRRGMTTRWAKQYLHSHPRSPSPAWGPRNLAYWVGHWASTKVSCGKGNGGCHCFTCCTRFRTKSSLQHESFGKFCSKYISNSTSRHFNFFPSYLAASFYFPHSLLILWSAYSFFSDCQWLLPCPPPSGFHYKEAIPQLSRAWFLSCALEFCWRGCLLAVPPLVGLNHKFQGNFTWVLGETWPPNLVTDTVEIQVPSLAAV